MPLLKLSKIWIYPIKSTRRVNLLNSFAEPRGLKGDRRWMLIDAKGRFISQREHPKLALVQATYRHGQLSLRAPGQPPFECEGAPENTPGTVVEIWNDTITSQLIDPKADAWFSKFLGDPCRLVRMRPTDERLIEQREGVAPGTTVSFADGYPIMLLGTGSLEDLNQRLASPLAMTHFRPNLVISGTTPYQEDQWSQIVIGEVTFKVVKPCKRCVMTTIDPETAEKAQNGEPLRTLATYRAYDGGVIFGQNLVVQKPGRLEVGQAVEVIA